MPGLPLPPAIDDFLSRPNPAVMATLRPDGSPHTAPTWYDWEDGRALVNMEASQRRLANIRRDPRVAMSVLDDGSWYRHVTLSGRVVSIEADPDHRDMDRLSVRYTGLPHERRDQERWSAWVAITSWYGWVGSGPWLG